MTHKTPLLMRTAEEMRPVLEGWRKDGKRIGFVPTMGALHDGHMKLVDAACRQCDHVVASIFVNPTQFGPNEDYSRYPRSVDRDVDLLAEHACDMVFLPDVHTIYPEGFDTTVSVGNLAKPLCGNHRDGHFDGVATVVSILLTSVRPDTSFFGEKDYQQLLIIKRLNRDVIKQGEIIGVPTFREDDGLAYSSRNQYLTPEERDIAPSLYAALSWARQYQGSMSGHELAGQAKQQILDAGFETLDYCEIRHKDTLELLDDDVTDGRIFAAAWLGSTRLIDNVAMNDDE